MTTALTLACAMILDALLGEPKWLWRRVPHPAVLMGRLIDLGTRRLNHEPAKSAKGVVLVVGLVLLGIGLGTLLGLGGSFVEIIIAAILLAQKSLVQHVRAVADGLRLSLAQGRREVAMIVSRDTAAMAEPAVARSAIESAAENLSDGVIAPAFWFLIGGLPGLITYKLINTADSMIGYRTEEFAAFGWAAARLDDALNFLPARLTAAFIAVQGHTLTSWPAIAKDAARHRSPNAGWPEAAMAYSIDVALAGPRAYDGVMQDFAWVHPDGKRQIGAPEIDAAVRGLWRSWAVALALVLAIGLLT